MNKTMKKWMIGFGLVAMMIAIPPQADAQVVIVKPVKPKVIVVTPQHVRKRHIWREGHWKWNARTKSYVWIRGAWVRSKRGMQWVQGHWKKVPNGWIWVESRWRRV